MEILVFSDCHWHGPTPKDVDPEFGDRIFYIGDNHELKNIPYKKVTEYERQYLDFLGKCSATRTNILNGNHEVSIGYNNNNVEVLLKNDSIAFVHFHRESWSAEAVKDWHTRTPGKSRKKILAIKIKNIFRNMIGMSSLGEKHIKICHEIAKKYNVQNVVFGHTHPRKLIIETHKDETGKKVTMINVPRGKTPLSYDNIKQILSSNDK